METVEMTTGTTSDATMPISQIQRVEPRLARNACSAQSAAALSRQLTTIT